MSLRACRDGCQNPSLHVAVAYVKQWYSETANFHACRLMDFKCIKENQRKYENETNGCRFALGGSVGDGYRRVAADSRISL